LFLQTNDRIINLRNVSNINVLKDRNRIVFNLNYNIEISKNQNGDPKFISDYAYWDAIDEADLQHNIAHLKKDAFFTINFINGIDQNCWINIKEISSIKFSEKKHRVIFNLSHPITFKDFNNNERITSEFVYVNCKDFESYVRYVEYVKEKLEEIGE